MDQKSFEMLARHASAFCGPTASEVAAYLAANSGRSGAAIRANVEYASAGHAVVKFDLSASGVVLESEYRNSGEITFVSDAGCKSVRASEVVALWAGPVDDDAARSIRADWIDALAALPALEPVVAVTPGPAGTASVYFGHSDGFALLVFASLGGAGKTLVAAIRVFDQRKTVLSVSDRSFKFGDVELCRPIGGMVVPIGELETILQMETVEDLYLALLASMRETTVASSGVSEASFQAP